MSRSRSRFAPRFTVLILVVAGLATAGLMLLAGRGAAQTSPGGGKAYSFGVTLPSGTQIDDVTVVTGLATRIAVVEHQTTDAQGQTEVRKVPGGAKYGEVTLTRPLDGDSTFRSLSNAVLNGRISEVRGDYSVKVFDKAGELTQTVLLRGAFVSGYSVSKLVRANTRRPVEKVTLAVDEIVIGE